MQDIFSNFKKPILIVGIGNPLKGDDGAGPFFADKVISGKKETAAINCLEVPENYLTRITSSGAATILFVDAVEMGEMAGFTKIFDTEKIMQTGISTHGISLALIAETVKQESGTDVYLLGIQPKSGRLGEGLSKEVEKSVLNLVALIE
jgi:hydrogenase 3 maturation protease